MIKRFALMAMLAVGVVSGLNVQAEEEAPAPDKGLCEKIVDEVIVWIPNRCLDLFDVFSAQLGVGPVIKAEARVTRLLQLGGGIGPSAKIIKGYNRQYGMGLESGWDLAFLWFQAEDRELPHTLHYSAGAKKYRIDERGIPLPSSRYYDIGVMTRRTAPRDYWAIGAEVACFVEAAFEVHPVEIVDFATGIFFVDLRGDDKSREDFSWGFEHETQVEDLTEAE